MVSNLLHNQRNRYFYNLSWHLPVSQGKSLMGWWNQFYWNNWKHAWLVFDKLTYKNQEWGLTQYFTQFTLILTRLLCLHMAKALDLPVIEPLLIRRYKLFSHRHWEEGTTCKEFRAYNCISLLWKCKTISTKFRRTARSESVVPFWYARPEHG